MKGLSNLQTSHDSYPCGLSFTPRHTTSQVFNQRLNFSWTSQVSVSFSVLSDSLLPHGL